MSNHRLPSVLLEGYVRAGGGWLGTKVDSFADGVLRQREEYTEFRVDVHYSTRRSGPPAHMMMSVILGSLLLS